MAGGMGGNGYPSLPEYLLGFKNLGSNPGLNWFQEADDQNYKAAMANAMMQQKAYAKFYDPFEEWKREFISDQERFGKQEEQRARRNTRISGYLLGALGVMYLIECWLATIH